MKKLVVLFILGTLLSCDISSGDDNLPIDTVLMSITSADLPAEFTLNESYEITVNYLRPNDCYEFNNFIFQPNGNTRTVAAVDNIYNRECSVNPVEASVSFDLRVVSSETYIFQFYQGSGANGEDQYLIIEVPVVE